VAPAPTPLKPSTAHHPVIGSLVVITCLLILFALGFIFWPQLTAIMQPKPVAPVVQLPMTTSTATAVQTATTTQETSTSSTTGCLGPDGAPGHFFGEHVILLLNDGNAFCKSTEHVGQFTVTARVFGDSRCQPGMQCIWAGEQSVTIEARTEGQNSQMETFTLGTVRAKSGILFGHTVTLNEIDEGKGGTYADVTVE